MTIFRVGLGASLVVMIVGIGLALSKDVTDLIDFAYDPNYPTNGPRRV
jgi:ABC-type antimicrobial peptide transport system permease subunit